MSKSSDKQLPSENQIRERAYEIYASRGYSDGREVEDWLIAEQELQQLTESRPAAKPEGRSSAASLLKSTSNIPATRADSATAGPKRA